MTLFGRELTKSETLLLALTALLAVGAVFLGISRSAATSEVSPKEILQSLKVEEERLSRALKDGEKRRTELGLGEFTLPDPETDSPTVHLHIEKTARSCGLAFPSLSATASKKGKGVLTIGYRFTATGELKSFIKFIDQIQSGQYLVCLESWDMSPTEDPKNVRANLALRAYFQPAGRRGRN